MIKKKILFITHSLHTGGAEKMLISLVNQLDYTAIDCSIISYSENNSLAIHLNKEVNLITLPRKTKFDLGPIIKTRRYSKIFKPDAYFCIGFFTFFLIHLSNLLSSKNTRRIISYHTTIHRNRKNHLLMIFYSKFLTKKDQIITVCENQIAYTVKKYGIKTHYFTSIHNGVDTNFWRPANTIEETTLIRMKYGIPIDAKLIIQTAAFRPEKNHKAAIDAFNLLSKKGYNNLYLVFVGEGLLQSKMEDYVTQLKLSDKIFFVGNQDNVLPYYWASDIFSLSSKEVETFSIAALEALNCGLPCVLTNIGGANEMIENGVNGYLTNTHFEDIAFHWNKALVTDFDKNSISVKAKSKFSLKRMVDQYTQLINAN
jgi:glycosyltransferase involved in cell wall biosynthesis